MIQRSAEHGSLVDLTPAGAGAGGSMLLGGAKVSIQALITSIKEV